MRTVIFLLTLMALSWAMPANADMDVEVDISWIAPTQNVDGSALVDLGGYRIWWGNTSRTYTAEIDLADATALNATITALGVVSGDNIYLSMTAYDMNNPSPGHQVLIPVSLCADTGNETACDNESAYSNEIVRGPFVERDNIPPVAIGGLIPGDVRIVRCGGGIDACSGGS